jgi:hypothetical protein
MPKYTVLTFLGVDHVETVEAENPEGALGAIDDTFTLCCHCSEHADLGEPMSYIVLDEAGEKVWEEDLCYHPPCSACKSLETEGVEVVALIAGLRSGFEKKWNDCRADWLDSDGQSGHELDLSYYKGAIAACDELAELVELRKQGGARGDN